MMNLRTIFVTAAAAFVLGAAAPALADAAYDACLKPAVTNYDFGVCGSAYLKRTDDALNAVWRAVFSQTSGQTKTDLLAEQRLWVAFKDKSCQFWANGDWGREGQVLSYPACRAAVIEERTRALKIIGKDIAPK